MSVYILGVISLFFLLCLGFSYKQTQKQKPLLNPQMIYEKWTAVSVGWKQKNSKEVNVATISILINLEHILGNSGFIISSQCYTDYFLSF